MESHAQTAGDPAKYGNPTDLFSLYGRHGYDPAMDFSADFRTFGPDWQEDRARQPGCWTGGASSTPATSAMRRRPTSF